MLKDVWRSNKDIWRSIWRKYGVYGGVMRIWRGVYVGCQRISGGVMRIYGGVSGGNMAYMAE